MDSKDPGNGKGANFDFPASSISTLSMRERKKERKIKKNTHTQRHKVSRVASSGEYRKHSRVPVHI